MVSEKDLKPTSAAPLTEDEIKDLAKSKHKLEVSEMKTSPSKWVSSPTAFDKLPAHEKPFTINPFPNERQRLPFKMTEEDRLRRKNYLHSQELTDREPMNVPELERMIYNPIRRLYRAPMDRLFNLLGPVIGEHRVRANRVVLPKIFMVYLSGCFLWYQFKYNKPSWEQQGGFKMVKTQGILLPEDQKPEQMKNYDYADKGFQSRSVFKGDKYAY